MLATTSTSFSSSDSTTDCKRSLRAELELETTRRLWIDPELDVLTSAGVFATEELEGDGSI